MRGACSSASVMRRGRLASSLTTVLKNKAKPTDKQAAKVAKEVKAELRAKLKEKLNGHYKDIEEIVQ